MTEVKLEDDSSCDLADLYRDTPIALVFLRHFGCVFCRYQVAQLRSASDLPIYFVCMEPAEEAAAFKTEHRSPHHFISDPDRKLYEAYGVRRGTAGQLFSLRTIGRGLKATLAGSFQGKPTSDPMQLGATIILDQDGEVAWSRYAKDAAEIITEKELREQLQRLGKGESAIPGENDPSSPE